MKKQQDTNSLESSANESAEKAECLHNVEYISQPNSMHCTAKKKREEVNAVEHQIEAALQVNS